MFDFFFQVHSIILAILRHSKWNGLFHLVLSHLELKITNTSCCAVELDKKCARSMNFFTIRKQIKEYYFALGRLEGSILFGDYIEQSCHFETPTNTNYAMVMMTLVFYVLMHCSQFRCNRARLLPLSMLHSYFSSA